MSLPAMGVEERGKGEGTLEYVGCLFPLPPPTLPYGLGLEFPGLALKYLLLTPWASMSAFPLWQLQAQA
jgi:hypothetical protein